MVRQRWTKDKKRRETKPEMFAPSQLTATSKSTVPHETYLQTHVGIQNLIAKIFLCEAQLIAQTHRSLLLIAQTIQYTHTMSLALLSPAAFE